MMLFGVFAMYIFWFGFIAIVLYAAYRVANKLLDKSLDVKREQNRLLREFIQVMNEKKQAERDDSNSI